MLLAVLISQAPNLERLSSAYHSPELLLRHRHLSTIHKVYNCLHLPSLEVLQHDHRVFAWILAKYPAKQRTAGTQQHLVSSHAALSTHQRDVH